MSPYDILLTVVDVILGVIAISIYILLITKLIKKDPDFQIKFYGILVLNNSIEFLFIGVEYFLVRFPLMGYFNEWYLSVGKFPGCIYGLSVYLPCVIALGQLTQTINRFVVIKFPLSFNKIFNKWLIGSLLLLQIFFPITNMIWSWNETVIVHSSVDNETIIVEMDNSYTQNMMIEFGVFSMMLTCAACCFFGIWSFIIVLKMRKSNHNSLGQLKRELNLFMFVGLEIMAQILLIIAALVQLYSGLGGLNNIYIVALHLYPFFENFLCLTNGIMLLIACSTVRKHYLHFYFKFIYKWKKKNPGNKKTSVIISASHKVRVSPM
uniref:Serpentine receptor class gamma n=1 Tax=Parastrongyloides trichosuri TaxID=131310 RepID=A0A0N4ZAL8_PARTI